MKRFPYFFMAALVAISGFGFATSDLRSAISDLELRNAESDLGLRAGGSAIRNPQSAIKKRHSLPCLVFTQIPSDFGFLTSDFGLATCDSGLRNVQSAIRNPQSAIHGARFLPPLRNISGSRIVSLDLSKGGKSLRILTPEFASACSPNISFDGKRVVFAGKKGSDEPWNVWEMDANGANKRRIVETPWDCLTPTYLPSIYTLDNLQPRDQVVFAASATGAVNEYGEGPAWSFYTCELSGKNLRRITFNLSADFDPTVLPDGRILFSSWQRYGSRYYPTGLFPLLTVMTDGTDLYSFYGNQGLPIMKCKPVVGRGGWVYFVESDGTNPLGGGSIAAVNLRRNMKTYTPIASDPKALFYSPFPLDGGNLLISHRKIGQSQTYGLCELSLQTGQIANRLFDDPAWHDVEARAVLPRLRPKGRSSVVNYAVETADIFCLDCYLTDWPGMKNLPAGSLRRLRVIEGIPLREATAIADCGLRIAESGPRNAKSEMRSPKSGEGGARSSSAIADCGIPNGKFRRDNRMARMKSSISCYPVKKIRNPKSGEGGAPSSSVTKKYSGTSFGPRRILGDVPLPKDGSFYIKVPPETPIAFQVLDENNMAVLTHRNWMWGMPKENRGCIGCHEDRERTPPNRLAEALKKPAPNLNVPPEKRRTVDFQHEIAPLIKTRCLQCHTSAHVSLDLSDLGFGISDSAIRNPHSAMGGGEPGGFPRAYEILLSPSEGGAKELAGRYIKPGSARESPLVWRLLGFRISDFGFRTSDSAVGSGVRGQGAGGRGRPRQSAIGGGAPPSAIGNPRSATDAGARQSAIRNPQSAIRTGAAELMPPNSPLSDSERELFIEWIDLGAQWSNRPSPGDIAAHFGFRQGRLFRQDNGIDRMASRASCYPVKREFGLAFRRLQSAIRNQ